MKRKTLTIAVSITFLLMSVSFALDNQGVESPGKLFREHIIPLASIDPGSGSKDLDFLKNVLVGTSILLIGESQHLQREQYQLKHRITRFLVEEMDFSHIVIEDSFYGTIDINDYIHGADVSAEDSLQKTGGWYLWDTEEMLSLLNWLKTHNEKAEDGKKVFYVGIDIQDPWPGIIYLVRYFEKTDRNFSGFLESNRKLLEVFNQDIWFKIQNSYSELTLESRMEIEKILLEARRILEKNKEVYIKAAGEKEFNECVSVVEHLIRSHKFFVELQDIKDGEVGIREKTMFENIVRIKESNKPAAKIVVWVHNAHAAKSPVSLLNTSDRNTGEMDLLGAMLNLRYGDEVKSLGMASLGMKKEPDKLVLQPDVLDHALAETEESLCYLDFEGLASLKEGKNPLEATWKLTADQGGFISLVPAKSFDGLIFIKNTTGVRPSMKSAERFKKLFGE